jgi:hypothetical protein
MFSLAVLKATTVTYRVNLRFNFFFNSILILTSFQGTNFQFLLVANIQYMMDKAMKHLKILYYAVNKHLYRKIT